MCDTVLWWLTAGLRGDVWGSAGVGAGAGHLKSWWSWRGHSGVSCLVLAWVCVALRGNRSGLQSKCTTSSYVSARAAVGYKSGIAVFTFKITSSSNSYLSFGVAKDDNGGDYRER